jgi:hypothetical protein
MTRPVPTQTHESPDDADPMIDALLAEFVSTDQRRRVRPPDLTARILKRLDAPVENRPAVEIEDADPMVDALLAEFVPQDSDNRKRPPDLSAAILEKLAASATARVEDADPMVDTLLMEFVPVDQSRRVRPPDLSDPILGELEELANLKQHRPGVNRSGSGVAPVSMMPAGTLSLNRVLSTLVAIAACLFGVIWLAGRNARQDKPEVGGANGAVVTIAENDSAERRHLPEVPPSASSGSGDSRLANSPPEGTPSVPDRATDAEPPVGVSLDPPMLASDSDPGRRNGALPRHRSDPAEAVQPLALVAARTAQTARDYWTALGITPTPDATGTEISSRLKRRLGVSLDEQTLADPQRLRDVLAESSNANQIAKRWLASTSGAVVASFSEPENQDLVEEVAKAVSGESKLDVTLISLIDGSSKQSSKWYETIGRGGTEGIAKRLASLSMDADLRCVKCHDSMIGRSGTQDDYWSFVALVRGAFERRGDRWVVSDEKEPKPVFYELRDGRQRMAPPKVSRHLLQSDKEISDFRVWASTLADSRALAAGMVDSLWNLVQGRKLKPSPVDAVAPPVDESLDRLHQQLAEDLRASGFDVARTLALIIASPMARRSVPEALREETLLTATDAQRSEALELVGAFAAAIDTPQSSLKARLDVAMRRVGGRLSPDDQGTLLAQRGDGKTGDVTGSAGDVQQAIRFLRKVSVDFPGDDVTLPVSWLRSIDDYDQQVQHLVYLSGGDKVSPDLKDAAERLRTAGSRESALSRLWWILRQ